MQTIESKVKNAIKKTSRGRDSNELSSLEASLREFKALVESGVAQPRGYTLHTIDCSLHSSSVEFNV